MNIIGHMAFSEFQLSVEDMLRCGNSRTKDIEIPKVLLHIAIIIINLQYISRIQVFSS
jgi:hypothetical protein